MKNGEFDARLAHQYYADVTHVNVDVTDADVIDINVKDADIIDVDVTNGDVTDNYVAKDNRLYKQIRLLRHWVQKFSRFGAIFQVRLFFNF